MLKNLAILYLISTIILGTNIIWAQDDVGELVEAVDLVDEYFASGKNIDYIQGHIKANSSCCNWWNYCWYWYENIPNAKVELYIRANNENGGEKWLKTGESQTDEIGYYSFGQLKNYCGPTQIKVTSLQHYQIIDYSRYCNKTDSGRVLDVVGEYPCKKE